VLAWNPAASGCGDFEEMEWFDQLTEYGLADDGELDEADPDLQLVPDLVEDVLLAKLAGVVEFVWNPFSERQTAAVLGLTQRLVDDYPTVGADREPTKVLFAAVAARLGRAIATRCALPGWPAQVTGGKGGDAVAAAVLRQLAIDAGLIRAIRSWDGLLSTTAVQGCAVELLSARVVPALRSLPFGGDSVARIEAIAADLPASWFAGGSGPACSARLGAAPFTALVLEMRKEAQAVASTSTGFLAGLAATTGTAWADALDKVLKGLGEHGV
jgi:GC-rich sequence DNA-binding factor